MSFTIDSELPKSSIEQCAERAEQSKVTPVLRTDRPPSQNFAVISILGPHTRQQSDIACVQILGAFPDAEVANKFAKDVSRSNPHFDLFVVQMGKWLPLNGSPDQSTNETWRNEKVQELMNDYATYLAVSNEMYHERKNLLLNGDTEAPEDVSDIQTL